MAMRLKNTAQRIDIGFDLLNAREIARTHEGVRNSSGHLLAPTVDAATWKRDERMKRLVERLARIAGFASVSALAGAGLAESCQITRDGIVIVVNPQHAEEMAERGAISGENALTLATVETMRALQLVGRARDFFDPSYFSWANAHASDGAARRFLDVQIDAMVADFRLMTLPFFRSQYPAYAPCAIPGAMRGMPLHRQFALALRRLVLEDSPQLDLAPFVEIVLMRKGDKTPLVSDVAALITDQDLSYEQRHERASLLLLETYKQFQLIDRALDIEPAPDMPDSLGLDPAGAVGLGGAAGGPGPGESKQRARDAPHAVGERAEQLPMQDDALGSDQGAYMQESGAYKADASIVTKVLISGMADIDWPSLPSGQYAGYRLVVEEWRETIEQVGDVFAQIATRKERSTVPRYAARLAQNGRVLCPHALVKADVQLETGKPMPIWRSIKRRPRRFGDFDGLDIYLLFDMSMSMAGERARYAATTGVCLMEGLRVSKARETPSRFQEPVDIRIQLIGFGMHHLELSPLSAESTQEQRVSVYDKLLNPGSMATRICASLNHVRNGALAHPARDVLCMVVTDGLLSDARRARNLVHEMPDNVYLGHVNIGDLEQGALTENYETVYDPATLPEKLAAILEERFEAQI